MSWTIKNKRNKNKKYNWTLKDMLLRRKADTNICLLYLLQEYKPLVNIT